MAKKGEKMRGNIIYMEIMRFIATNPGNLDS